MQQPTKSISASTQGVSTMSELRLPKHQETENVHDVFALGGHDVTFPGRVICFVSQSLAIASPEREGYQATLSSF